jgi:hypothetical protein|nr:MAG TPA: hypothetical protein [Crassvirales sp.]
MIKLFKYEGYQVTIEPEALMLKPFKAIYNRDKSKNKNTAMQELAYIYFMTDPRSDYQYLTDADDRSKAIIEGEGMADTWKPDNLVLAAIDFYKSFNPTSSLLLEDTRLMVDKFRNKIRELNFDDLEVKDLKDAIGIVKQIPGLVKDLDEAERAVSKEIINSAKARGSQTKSLYEDGE